MKFGISLLVFIALVMILSNKNENLVKVQSGEYLLECYIDDEYKLIDKDKVKDFDDEKGYWIFTNGFAKNCELIGANE